MHLPSLSQLFTGAAFYIAGASVVVNVLPKETFLDGYPRAKAAYRTGVAFAAASAINLRKCLPGLDIKIPGLGFDQYQHDHPELFDPNPSSAATSGGPAGH